MDEEIALAQASPSIDNGLLLGLDNSCKLLLCTTESQLIHITTSTRNCIPLYNILWIEVSGPTIVIDFAVRNSKASLIPAQWTLPLEQGSIPCSRHNNYPQVFAEAVLSHAYGPAKRQRRALVLVNPHAGQGKAESKWTIQARPLFEAARILMDETVLKQRHEATEIVQAIPINKYDMMIACSGDGVAHEIFNGLAKRPDAKTALSQIAVCHVPCGSGNAMSHNLYGSDSASEAALAIIKGIVMPLDLVSITQGSDRIISFLSQALGILAECDLETEHMRWMGSLRFEVGFFMRIFRKKSFPCDLAIRVAAKDKSEVAAHYKQHKTANHTKSELVVTAEALDDVQDCLPKLKYGTIHDELSYQWELLRNPRAVMLYFGNMPYIASNAEMFRAALPNDGCLDLVIVNGPLDVVEATKLLLSVKAGKFFQHERVIYKKVYAYRVIPKHQKDGSISIDGERLPFGPFQAEVHQSLGRVIAKRPDFIAPGL